MIINMVHGCGVASDRHELRVTKQQTKIRNEAGDQRPGKSSQSRVLHLWASFPEHKVQAVALTAIKDYFSSGPQVPSASARGVAGKVDAGVAGAWEQLAESALSQRHETVLEAAAGDSCDGEGDAALPVGALNESQAIGDDLTGIQYVPAGRDDQVADPPRPLVPEPPVHPGGIA
jgi:hypothetical protein